MKKSLYLIVSIIALCSMMIATAASPALVKSITLQDFRYVINKGYVLFFDVKGSADSFKGVVFAGTEQIDLKCTMNDNDMLVCQAGSGLKAYSGQNVTIVINRQYTFTAMVPTGTCPEGEVLALRIWHWYSSYENGHWDFLPTHENAYIAVLKHWGGTYEIRGSMCIDPNADDAYYPPDF